MGVSSCSEYSEMIVSNNLSNLSYEGSSSFCSSKPLSVSIFVKLYSASRWLTKSKFFVIYSVLIFSVFYYVCGSVYSVSSTWLNVSVLIIGIKLGVATAEVSFVWLFESAVN